MHGRFSIIVRALARAPQSQRLWTEKDFWEGLDVQGFFFEYGSISVQFRFL